MHDVRSGLEKFCVALCTRGVLFDSCVSGCPWFTDWLLITVYHVRRCFHIKLQLPVALPTYPLIFSFKSTICSLWETHRRPNIILPLIMVHHRVCESRFASATVSSPVCSNLLVQANFKRQLLLMMLAWIGCLRAIYRMPLHLLTPHWVTHINCFIMVVALQACTRVICYLSWLLSFSPPSARLSDAVSVLAALEVWCVAIVVLWLGWLKSVLESCVISYFSPLNGSAKSVILSSKWGWKKSHCWWNLVYWFTQWCH